MKRINNIFLVAAAAALALVSCTKETTGNNEKNVDRNASVRTITVSFAGPEVRTNPTSVGNDIQPVWAGGETLTLKCGDQTENVVVPSSAANNTSFEFTTELQGTIEVYYPGGTSDYDKYWDASGNVKIPASQSGDFATANLCKGTVAEDGTNLTLFNQTALFQVTPPSGVKKFTITSLQSVVGGVARTGTAQSINTEGADAALVITVGDNSTDRGTYYVALAEGVNLSDLSFEYKSNDTHGAMKGIPMKDIPEGKNAVVAGNAYTITSQNWHEYVTVAGKKWATMNIGATAETGEASYGTYFAWGDVVGQTPSSATFSHGFSWTNCPYSDGSFDESTHKNSFTKYVNSDHMEYWGGSGNVDDKTTLDLEDDAAFANWGGAWHMPADGDFSNLNNVGSAWDGEKKVKTFGSSPNTIIFPLSGYGYDANLDDVGDVGSYWSSSLGTDNSWGAYHIDIFKRPWPTGLGRFVGRSVRPLSE